MNDVDLCGEVVQKKQEFGGAKLKLNNENCFRNLRVGSNSASEMLSQ